MPSKKRSKSSPAKSNGAKKNANVASDIDTRPPFNLDTKIDGYDDVDEKGRYIRKGATMEAKKRTDQDQLNTQWLSSLRGGFHEA